MEIAVILVNWNGKKDTLECLKSLYKSKTKHTLTVFVIDNGSSDGSISAIQKQFPQIILIRNSDNKGFSEANNQGIQKALEKGAHYLWILNNDTTVSEHCLDEQVLAAVRHTNKAAIGPKIYFYPGSEFHKDRYVKKDQGNVFWYAGGRLDWDNVLATHRGVDETDSGQYEKEQETDFISGCSLFVHRSVFEHIGGFDSDYFAYYEDVDFSVRLKQNGYHLLYVPKAVVWHKNASSSGGSGSHLQQYYMIRNQLILGFRYAPLRARISLIRQSVVILLKGSFWEKWGVIDFFFGKLGKTERKS